MIELKIDAQICSKKTVIDTKACKSAFFIFRNVCTDENNKNSDYFFQNNSRE